MFATACAVIGLGAAADAGYGSPISFDPDGPNAHGSTSNSAVSVSSFEFQPGNVLLQGALASAVAPEQSLPIDVYLQFRVLNLLDSNGDPIPLSGFEPPPGGGREFELTAVGHFKATATRHADFGSSTTWSLALAAGSPNRFEMWYDDNPLTKASDFTGLGFNDGTRILSGTLSNIDAGDYLSNVSSVSAFDQFSSPNTAHYSDYTTAAVGGDLTFTAGVTSQNSQFFRDELGVVTVTPSTNLNSPYHNVDPSEAFTSLLPSTSPGDVSPDLGASKINGVSGNDIQLEATHPTASFETAAEVVPEPGAVWGCLIGAGWFGASRQRRRRNVV